MNQKTINRVLYGYWRSSASYRVRLALNLKGLDYQQHSIHLAKGEQHNKAFRQLNPQGLIPLYLEESREGTIRLAQSLAILDYLEDSYPDTPLLPSCPVEKATVKSLALIVACEIHPLNNLRVLTYLEEQLQVEGESKMAWYHHWIANGFKVLETELTQFLADKTYSLGERPGYLEALIIPQVYNANRFNCPLDDYPKLRALVTHCEKLPAFIQAHPSKQPDAPNE